MTPNTIITLICDTLTLFVTSHNFSIFGYWLPQTESGGGDAESGGGGPHLGGGGVYKFQMGRISFAITYTKPEYFAYTKSPNYIRG